MSNQLVSWMEQFLTDMYQITYHLHLIFLHMLHLALNQRSSNSSHRREDFTGHLVLDFMGKATRQRRHHQFIGSELCSKTISQHCGKIFIPCSSRKLL
jgi:hypothetical protein